MKNRNRYWENRRQERIKLGLCIKCPNRAESKNKRFCEEHRLRQDKLQRDFYHRLKAPQGNKGQNTNH